MSRWSSECEDRAIAQPSAAQANRKRRGHISIEPLADMLNGEATHSDMTVAEGQSLATQKS